MQILRVARSNELRILLVTSMIEPIERIKPKMSASPHISFEIFSDGVLLPSQYNDLARSGRSVSAGEYRLLWAVLEDAISTYLANRDCSTRNQRREFEEVCNWLHATQNPLQDLFTFASICEVFDIEADLLLKALESLSNDDSPIQRRVVMGTPKLHNLAA